MTPPPQYIGPNTPVQIVKVRLGRFSRYYTDNAHNIGAEGAEPMGAGHQPWDRAHFPCNAHVGTKHSNPLWYDKPWQALWIPTTAYVVVPNVLEVKLDKKVEGLIGGIGNANVQIENILYTAQVGGYHTRERGAMSPLRGYVAPGSPVMPPLLGELEEVVNTNEWEGRFGYAAQITVYQGFGTALAKTFTGLIEDIDSTSRPDRISLTCRDFGQVFSETHFFGWGKDPVIDTPVIFIDQEDASEQRDAATSAAASNEDKPDHEAEEVLDFKDTWWQTNVLGSAEQTEYVEVTLPEGVYHVADVRVKWAGMDVYVALKPTPLHGGLPPAREEFGGPKENMTVANNWLDKNGWVDPTKKEEQKVEGVNGGNSYTNLIENYPGGNQSTPIQKVSGEAVSFRVGPGTVLRLSFRKLHKVEAGENYRAGVEELHGLREATEAEAGKAQWVIVEDIADVIRTLCQWAGFKEWDIPQTGVRLPQRLVCYQDESYMDLIRKVCEGINFMFFLADPTPDNLAGGENSLGVPTFRKSRALANDTLQEKEEREAGYESSGAFVGGNAFPNRGSKRAGLPNPVIEDRTLLNDIDLKMTNEPLSYVLRVWGFSGTLPGDAAAGVASGHKVSYTFRPPWTGTPPHYADSRLGGVLKALVEHDRLFSSVELCRNAAWFIALRQAIEATEVTIEFPANPGLELDDHVQLRDLGTGISTRVALLSRSSSFIDGEKRKYTMTITGPLLDTPDVRDMVRIINGLDPANGAGGDWSDPHQGSGSSLGYG